MRSSAAEHTRPTLLDGLIVLLLLLAAGALLLAFRPSGGNFLTATVVLNNVEVAHFDLSALDAPVTFDVPGAPYPITIEADHGRIRVRHSDCPTQDCVHTGWISRDKGQIVCLPNRLVVSVTGGNSGGVDAVTG